MPSLSDSHWIGGAPCSAPKRAATARRMSVWISRPSRSRGAATIAMHSRSQQSSTKPISTISPLVHAICRLSEHQRLT